MDETKEFELFSLQTFLLNLRFHEAIPPAKIVRITKLLICKRQSQDVLDCHGSGAGAMDVDSRGIKHGCVCLEPVSVCDKDAFPGSSKQSCKKGCLWTYSMCYCSSVLCLTLASCYLSNISD